MNEESGLFLIRNHRISAPFVFSLVYDDLRCFLGQFNTVIIHSE